MAIQGDFLTSARLSQASLDKLGQLEIVDGKPKAEIIREGTEQVIGQLIIGDLTKDEVIERHGVAEFPAQLVSLRVSKDVVDVARYSLGFFDSFAPLVRAGVATQLERCDAPDFPVQLAEARAAIEANVDRMLDQ